MPSITTTSTDFHQDASYAEYSDTFGCAQENLYWPQDFSFPMLPTEALGFANFEQEPLEPLTCTPRALDENETIDPQKVDIGPPLSHRYTFR